MPSLRIMGVVNATPDSFSDGGRSLEAAIAHARLLIDQGADILDIGGESTRPGAAPVPADEEIAAISGTSDIVISIDTMKPEVARAAVAAGADIWNDISALTFAEDSLTTAVELGCEVILMHMRGDPRTMQDAPTYEDVAAEVCGYLAERAQAAMAAGIPRGKIWLDPGVGFGKHMTRHNLPLMRRMDEVVALGFPVLLGVSRKSFVAALDNGAAPADRLGGSLAAALWGVQAGVAAVRVHDVRETAQAVKVWTAIAGAADQASAG